jgi:biopolymer transport protein ExbD
MLVATSTNTKGAATMAISLASSAEGEPMSQMNTTPLIDVMLVLLIMFIITLPLMTHSITLEMQGRPGITETMPIDLSIEFDGTILWNGEVVEGFDQLAARLRQAQASSIPAELRVRAERRATYDTVAKVLSTARRSGIERIGIQGNE